jgi:hypothetical protein
MEPQRVAGHVLQLAQRLGAGVPAADEHEGQGTLPPLRVLGAGGQIELGEHLVAQVDRLANGLEADAELGQSRDRQGAGNRAGRQHEHVVGQAELLPAGQRHRCHTAWVVHRRDLAAQHPAASQHPAQRDDDLARLDQARGRLGQEWLVGHVRLSGHHRDGGLAPSEPPLQAQRRVHADVAAPGDEDVRCARI